MWCPDDMGRDSWDWVGPLAWVGEHASTPQSGVEAPRLLKRSLPRLYYCCCCCFDAFFHNGVYGNIHHINYATCGATPGCPRRRRTLHRRGLEKLKNAEKTKKKTLHRHHTLKRAHLCCETKKSTSSGDELNLRHFHCSEGNCRCMITATSITADLHLRQHELML